MRWGFDPWVRKIPWRWSWQPTPVVLPGESYGQKSLVGYSPKRLKESDVTEWLSPQHPFLKQDAPAFPDWLGYFVVYRGVFFCCCCFFIVEEPVSTHAGWTNIYMWLVDGMKLVTCPAWSAITWKQMNGVTCLLCHSLWQLTQEQCTMGKYTFQASNSSTFCYKVQFQGTSWLVCLCLIHRGCTQWRVCPVAILLWPRHGCLGSKTRYEHKTRHPHFGCNEWSLICNWRKSFERSSFFKITITFASHVSC